jgi:hypothetical protein
MMKKFFSIVVAMAIFFSASFVFAQEEKEKDGWKVSGEVSVGIHSKYVDEISGELSYGRPVSTQSAMIGVEKDATGFYLKAENFIPFEKKEAKESDFYLGFYTEAKGMKFDFGYAHYWVRKDGESDCHAVYGVVDFPQIGWRVVPFAKAEYRIASEKRGEGGFVYRGGLKREFPIHKKVSLTAEMSMGGNSGIHGYKVDNISFGRAKAEASVEISEQLKFKIYAFAQRNLGSDGGIASGTNGKAFLGMIISYFF